MVDLITRMLTADPAKRYTVSEMLQHPWVLNDLPPGTAELKQAAPPGGQHCGEPTSKTPPIQIFTSGVRAAILCTCSLDFSR